MLQKIYINNNSNFHQSLVINNTKFRLKPYELKEIEFYNPRKAYLNTLNFFSTKKLNLKKEGKIINIEIKKGYLKFFNLFILLVLIVFNWPRINAKVSELISLSTGASFLNFFSFSVGLFLLFIYSTILDYRIRQDFG